MEINELLVKLVEARRLTVTGNYLVADGLRINKITEDSVEVEGKQINAYRAWRRAFQAAMNEVIMVG